MPSNRGRHEPMDPKWVLAICGAIAYASIHLGLVMAGTGVNVVRLDESLRVFLDLVVGAPLETTRWLDNHPDLTRAPLVPTIIWTLVFLAVFITAALLLRKLYRHIVGADNIQGQATARELQKRVKGTQHVEVSDPFAFLQGKPLAARSEDTATIAAPPRMGKTVRIVVGRIVARISSSTGPVVVTSTKGDVVRLTAGIRRSVGNIHVFDPEGVMSWPNPTRWDIVAGCEEDREAQERARAMVAAKPMGQEKNSGFFSDASETVLRCLLHAAALDGRNFRDVLRWTRNFGDDTPYDILANDPRAVDGWLDDLRKFCRGDARETVDSTAMSLSNVLKAFAIESILDSVCPSDDAPLFDSSSFHSTTDTLYLLSESGENSLAAPIITALVTSVEKAARRASQKTASGRLSPPLSMVLDEVANVAPIPSLPSLMSDGGGRGILTWAVIQGRSQLRARWGNDGAETILNSSTILIVLGGLKDISWLEELSKLSSKREVLKTSTTQSMQGGSTQFSDQSEEVLTVGDIRELPEGRALMFYREMAAAVVDLPGFWETKRKAEFSASEAWVLEHEGLTTTEVAS